MEATTSVDSTTSINFKNAQQIPSLPAPLDPDHVSVNYLRNDELQDFSLLKNENSSTSGSVNGDSSLAQRLEKNKIAQRHFRARRKEYIQKLERQVKHMSNIQSVSKNLASKNQHLSMLLGQERATYVCKL